jgi:methionine-gamma-lyase
MPTRPITFEGTSRAARLPRPGESYYYLPLMSVLPARDSSRAVGGEFAVTARLPTLADVIEFKEATSPQSFGYYRYVSHPYLRAIQDRLEELFGCRRSRLAESREIALLELLLCLRATGAVTRLGVLKAERSQSPIRDAEFFAPLEARDFLLAGSASELGRGDVLLLTGVRGEQIGEPLRQEARRAAAAGVSVVAFLAEPPSRAPRIEGVKFWVTGLGGDRRGGAVVGASDRVMDRLAESMRRRGPYLTAREASPRPPFPDGDGDPRGACARVSGKLCQMEGGAEAFLYPTGMSAVTRVLDLLCRPGRSQVIAVGYLFNDTAESVRLAPGRPGEEPNRFFGVDEMDRLASAITPQTAAILTETITNPLNDVPDIPLLARLARDSGAALVVDNTIATPLLCRPLSLGADIVIHSTTKFLNGSNNHGGGAVVLRRPDHADGLARLRARWNDEMSPLEAAALERGLATLGPRMERFNANARRVVSFLAGHRGVGRLWFNGHPSHRSHAVAQRILSGPSSVISFTLARDSLEGLRAFYDSPLPAVIKAPSLGSDLTLLCPYTMLTHYHDTDEQLQAIGLPRFLVRVAVGCEEQADSVIASLEEALENSLRQPPGAA